MKTKKERKYGKWTLIGSLILIALTFYYGYLISNYWLPIICLFLFIVSWANWYQKNIIEKGKGKNEWLKAKYKNENSKKEDKEDIDGS